MTPARALASSNRRVSLTLEWWDEADVLQYCGVFLFIFGGYMVHDQNQEVESNNDICREDDDF